MYSPTPQSSAVRPFSPIDMLTPAQTCRELGIAEDSLITMVNEGHIAAYDLGGQIRFKAREVVATVALLAVA